MNEGPDRRPGVPDEDVTAFYIPSLAQQQRSLNARVLKQGDTFVVFDSYGDAQAAGPAAEGLFHEDTRYLSALALVFEGERPLLLSSRVTRDNITLVIDLANPDLYHGDRLVLSRDKVHLLRTKVLDDGACFECIDIRSFADHPVGFMLSCRFAADFADMFEVRGQHRLARGEIMAPHLGATTAILGYRGLDGVERRTHIEFQPAPAALGPNEARFAIHLTPYAATRITLAVRCERGGAIAMRVPDLAAAITAADARMRSLHDESARLHGSNTAFNAWIERAEADLDMLVTDLPTGPYPYAGIPWFNTAFGRDGIITALETLWAMPQVARGALAFLAANQAREVDPAHDAEPGKILHETRKGEMAALGEVPFGRYYGSVDATPLFVVLAAAYHARTGDVEFIRCIWPAITAALEWLDTYGDRDRDGFVEYERRAEDGLANQGWKDSGDSIFHADGELAMGPIALVEVQAYAYAAWAGAAALATALGHAREQTRYAERATRLQAQFEQAFWCEEIGTYALALDGAKRACRVRSSNAGHALFAGIATAAHAARTAATLMADDHFSGWGIRTVARGEPRFNPMSYHNGSVWPHDNGLIAMGFGRYGLRAPLLKVFEGMFDAAFALELHRLPELFCGFDRRAGEGPTLYPVACNPQAWSSALVYAVLGAALGLTFHPEAHQIRFTRPVMPDFLDEVRIDRLSLGDSVVDLLFRRSNRGAALNVLRKCGQSELVLIA